MARTKIKVALHLPRNTYTTSNTTRNVMTSVSFRESILLMMFLELSMTVVIFTSEGSVRCICARAFFTPFITSTELAPVCFCMTICAPCTPSV